MRPAILLLAALAAGCGAAPDDTGACGHGELRVEVPGDDPRACLDFGEVPVGNAVIRSLDVVNESDAARTLQLQVTPGFRLRSRRVTAACGSTRIDVLFEAESAGPVEGTITFTCDGCRPLGACLRGMGVDRP